VPLARSARRIGARLIGISDMTLGSLIASKPLTPKISAVGSVGAVGVYLATLSFRSRRRRPGRKVAGC
jgi:uncharacterized membrane protein YkgB